MRNTWLRLAFAVAGAWSSPVEVTEYQKELMAKVEVSAAQLSEAAVPQILAKLDSAFFREYLHDCCPSFAQLPAEELLKRLTRHMEAAEIVSGFPAIIDPAQMYPDSAGMSIDYGLNGSFFLNDWEAVLLHSINPPDVWRHATMQYTDASCDLEKQTVSLGDWPQGCHGHRIGQNYSLGKCYSNSAAPTIVYSYDCSGGNLTQTVWMVNQNETKIQPDVRIVPCPETPPVEAPAPILADGKCHSQTVQNSTESWIMQDHAETIEYGLKAFNVTGAPKTLAEAQERPVYALANNNLIDQGSPIYGDVSAVFSSKYIESTTLLSPMDTGFAETCCVEKRDFPWAPKYNCSAFSAFKQLGTMKHYKHLFLINEDFWTSASSLRSIFMRMEGAWGSHPLQGKSFLNYFEAAVLGRLELPSAVRFLIGEFPTLFGTELGERLPRWARRSGKVLVWALGPNNQPKAALPSASTPAFNFDLLTSPRPFHCNQRILDPTVLGNTSAADFWPTESVDRSNFEKLWAKVAETRQERTPTNTTMAQYWDDFSKLLGHLKVRPIGGEDCQKQLLQGECVGVTMQGECVCYKASVSVTEMVV